MEVKDVFYLVIIYFCPYFNLDFKSILEPKKMSSLNRGSSLNTRSPQLKKTTQALMTTSLLPPTIQSKWVCKIIAIIICSSIPSLLVNPISVDCCSIHADDKKGWEREIKCMSYCHHLKMDGSVTTC